LEFVLITSNYTSNSVTWLDILTTNAMLMAGFCENGNELPCSL